jgi:hypothetical protein
MRGFEEEGATIMFNPESNPSQSEKICFWAG